MEISMKIGIVKREDDNFTVMLEYRLHVDTSEMAPVAQLKSEEDVKEIKRRWTEFIHEQLAAACLCIGLRNPRRLHFNSLFVPNQFHCTAVELFDFAVDCCTISVLDFKFSFLKIGCCDGKMNLTFRVELSDGEEMDFSYGYQKESVFENVPKLIPAQMLV
eukprot:GHVS01097951.1.p1 GENE.GHVS01097951.1~~GHVS01097951.1.p1  ORF type:complete len:161 (+),score=12.96 GHVS01097951.1:620-1102(+)